MVATAGTSGTAGLSRAITEHSNLIIISDDSGNVCNPVLVHKFYRSLDLLHVHKPTVQQHEYIMLFNSYVCITFKVIP